MTNILVTGGAGYVGSHYCNPRELTIGQLAKKLVEMTGSRSKLIGNTFRADDRLQWRPDIWLACENLD